MSGDDRQIVRIAPGDVGKPFFKAFGRVWPVSGFMGRILPRDVGKLVFLVDGILQVENDEQLEARQEREAGK